MTDRGTSTRIVRKPGLLLAFLGLSLLLLGLNAAAASAKTSTWNGSISANWSTAANWTGGLPVTAVDSLIFSTLSGSTKYALNNDLPLSGITKFSVKALTISNTDASHYYLLGGNALVVTGGVVDSATGAMDIISLPLWFNTTQTIEVSYAGPPVHELNILGAGIKGAGGVTKTGPGTLYYNSACSYNGDTLVSAGKLQVASSDAIPYGPGMGNVTVASSAVLELLQSATVNGLSGLGTIQPAGFNKYLSVGSNNATSTFSGSIIDVGSQALGVTKIGSGTFTLAGAGNSFSGGAEVTSGNMCVTGSAANSTFTVDSPDSIATLSGTGTVGPMVVSLPHSADSATTGMVSPGTSSVPVGTLNTGAETWNDGGSYAVDLSNTGSGHDLLNITGGLSVESTGTSPFTIAVTSLGSMSDFDAHKDYSWLIARTTGGITGFSAADFTLDQTGFTPQAAPLSPGLYLYQDGSNVYLRYSGSGTAVHLKSFATRVRRDGKVVVVWKTATRENVAGYVLQRRNPVTRRWSRVGPSIVPVEWGASAGATYRVLDPAARPSHRQTYRVREVHLGRGSSLYGPYKVMPRRR